MLRYFHVWLIILFAVFGLGFVSGAIYSDYQWIEVLRELEAAL